MLGDIHHYTRTAHTAKETGKYADKVMCITPTYTEPCKNWIKRARKSHRMTLNKNDFNDEHKSTDDGKPEMTWNWGRDSKQKLFFNYSIFRVAILTQVRQNHRLAFLYYFFVPFQPRHKRNIAKAEVFHLAFACRGQHLFNLILTDNPILPRKQNKFEK